MAGAQTSLRDAEGRVVDARQSAIDQTGAVTGAQDEAGGSYNKTREILKKLGLDHATQGEQIQGLIGWMGDATNGNDRYTVASELFGKRQAFAFVQAAEQSKGALQGIDAAMDNSKGNIGKLGKQTDDAMEQMKKAWNQFKAFIEPFVSALFITVTTFVENFIQNVRAIPFVFSIVWAEVKQTFETAKTILTAVASNMWDGLVNAFKAAINGILTMWNWLADKMSFKVPGWIPWLGGKEWSIPKADLLKYHSGGVVPGAMGTEHVALLQAGETIRTPKQEMAFVNGVSGGTTINITVNTVAGDPHAISQMVANKPPSERS